MEKRKPAKRRVPKRFTATLYTYVKPVNNRFAHGYGKKKFGSSSAYVDALIELDRTQKITQLLDKTAA